MQSIKHAIIMGSLIASMSGFLMAQPGSSSVPVPGLGVPDGVIESFELQVFRSASPSELPGVCRQIEREAERRVRFSEQGHSRLYRLAVSAYSRAGMQGEAHRVAEIVAAEPETVFDGIAANRMLGTLLADANRWPESAAAFARSLSYCDEGEYQNGRVRLPSMRGLAASMRAQGLQRDAIELQSQFLDEFGATLHSDETQRVLKALARDCLAVEDWEAADAWANRLFAAYPDWGDDASERLLFRIEMAAKGNREARRSKAQYVDDLRALWNSDEFMDSPAALLIADEMALALQRQRQPEEAHGVRLEIIDRLWTMESAWGSLRDNDSMEHRLARVALQNCAGKLLSDHASRRRELTTAELLDTSFLVADVFDDSPLVAKAKEYIAEVEALPND
ncbi:MAG: hypothetical protein Q9O74_00480 [Planctomycetota bacterium]|nr:hypothetical protein [Planctomycetota bacterium]